MNVSTWPSPKLMLRDHLAFAAMTAGGLFAVIIAIAVVYDIRSSDDVDQSFWAEAVTGVAPPYALGIGVYLMVVTFPRYVLYGETRKRFFQRIVRFSIPFSLGMALLGLAGWLLESVIYRIAGWEHTIGGSHLARSTRDAPHFVLELFITILPWFAFGALFGAIYLGRQSLLIAAIPLGVLGVGLVSMLLGLDEGPGGFVRSVFEPEPSTAIAVLLSLVITIAALWCMRIVTRDVAIQSQKA
ncbi:MAG: hypothetical protein KC438_00155 [Thermomicrobiales bacterium]|nr:hypothetical protein [Thermomicrobiales bacterium]MCO5220519.1 hypothetical protein [Thermomicrobiales bacterium]